MACLDTSFLIDILEGEEDARAVLEDIDITEKTVCIPSPAVVELWSGACLARHSESEKEKVRLLIESFEILPLDSAAALDAGEIEADLTKQGLKIQMEDVMIAGIARSRGETVVTRDQHYTRIPGLRVLKY